MQLTAFLISESLDPGEKAVQGPYFEWSNNFEEKIIIFLESCVEKAWSS